MNQKTQQHQDHSFWSRYWQSGSATSLPQDFQSNYDGEIAEFWQRQVSALPATARALDVCTGNGPVALLLAQLAREAGKTVQVTAIDAADISPSAAWGADAAGRELLSGIEFQGGHALEQSDLPDGSFDLLTSQFGIEYCDWNAAARQVFRLLKPGGHLAMISHSSGSDIIRTMTTEAEAYDLIEQMGVTAVIRGSIDGQLPMEQLSARLAVIGPALVQAHRQTGQPLVAQVLELLQQVARSGPDWIRERKQQLEDWLVQMRDGRLRLADMLRVYRAIDQAGGGEGHWTRVFTGQGLVLLEQSQLRYRGSHSMGDCCVMQKPA